MQSDEQPRATAMHIARLIIAHRLAGDTPSGQVERLLGFEVPVYVRARHTGALRDLPGERVRTAFLDGSDRGLDDRGATLPAVRLPAGRPAVPRFAARRGSHTAQGSSAAPVYL